MATGNKVEIEVKAQVTGEESVGALGRELESTGVAAKKLGTDAGGAASGLGGADAAAKGFTATSGKLRDGLESVSTQLVSARAELLALVGVGAGLQGAKDIATLADGYKNLEARIKLTTGAGQAFDAAFAGVFDVAKRTNSAVEETGVLFTKLAEAGKTLGVSQAEALKLTETINQSIQLSGASADASKASITQLVQGLQSGVLRGDEFNSVMEQSPRLAKALADGLGVTTGELRKMAEAGQLSSATIIKALQAQSDTVQAEFGKLPATVGRAMQNLSTAFTAYIGEADKAGGYTAKLAGVIDGLAGNLSTVATVMIHTGQVLGAMKLLSMAQDWLTASAAIKATAASTEVATSATVRGTAAKVANTTATVANTAAQTANAAAWNGVAAGLGGVGPKLAATGAAATSAAPMFGVLGGAVGGLMRAFGPLLALDVALHVRQYGTAIGEFAAKLMGAKDRTKEMAAMEKAAAEQLEANTAARKRQAAATKEAADRTFGLTKEGNALITKFDEMRTKGDSASAAIAAIGKDFDLSSVAGIRGAAAVLDKLASDGKLSADQFQAAWASALKGQDLALFEMRFKQGMDEVRAEADRAATALADAIARGLTGAELKVFEDKAHETMAAAGAEAKRFEQVVGSGLQEAVRRTGLDMNVISGGMGKAAQSAINDTEAIINGLDRLKAQGVDTAQVLIASIGKGINTADSQAAIQALRLQIESVRIALGEKIADGLLDQAKEKALLLSDALETVKPGIDSVREAMEKLGIASDQALKDAALTAKEAYEVMRDSGKASLRELQDSFVVYAQKAIAANDGVATAALKVEAAMRGIAIQTDAIGNAIVSAMPKGAAAIKTVEDAYHQLGLKTPEELKKISDANAVAWDKIKNDSKASSEAVKAAFTTMAQSAIAASGDVGSEQRQRTQELLAQEAALKGLTVSFDAEGKMIVQTQSEAAAALAKTNEKLKEQKSGVDEVTAALEKQNAVQEKKIAALEKENDLKKRAIDLENKRLNRDSEGFALDDQGNRRVTYRETERSLFDRIKAQGGNELTEAQVLALVQQFYRDQNTVNYLELTKEINATVMRNIKARAHADPTLGAASGDARKSPTPTGNPPNDPVAQDAQTQRVVKLVQQTPPAPAPTPAPSPVNHSQSSGMVKASETHLTINVAAGVNMASRGEVEKLARAIMPAINNLQRKGVSAG